MEQKKWYKDTVFYQIWPVPLTTATAAAFYPKGII